MSPFLSSPVIETLSVSFVPLPGPHGLRFLFPSTFLYRAPLIHPAVVFGFLVFL